MMSNTRALLATACVAITAVAGCAQPGVVEVNEMNPPIGAQDGAVIAHDTGAGPAPVQDSGVGPAPVQDTGVAPAQDAGVGPAQDTGVAPMRDAGVAQD